MFSSKEDVNDIVDDVKLNGSAITAVFNAILHILHVNCEGIDDAQENEPAYKHLITCCNCFQI